jgi:hypothetical protein
MTPATARVFPARVDTICFLRREGLTVDSAPLVQPPLLRPQPELHVSLQLVNCHSPPPGHATTVKLLHPSIAVVGSPFPLSHSSSPPPNRLPHLCCSSTTPSLTSSTGAAVLAGYQCRRHLGERLPCFQTVGYQPGWIGPGQM